PTDCWVTSRCSATQRRLPIPIASIRGGTPGASNVTSRAVPLPSSRNRSASASAEKDDQPVSSPPFALGNLHGSLVPLYAIRSTPSDDLCNERLCQWPRAR